MKRLAVIAAIAVSGCADPYANDSARKGEPPPPPGEQPSTPVDEAPERGIPSATPEDAARRAAELAGNWTAETIASRYAELARRTTGAARDDARQAAARARTDPELNAPGAKSIAIVHGAIARGTGVRRRVLVITHETLIADGLNDARWRVTVAEAKRQGHGWIISRWEPQP